MKNLTFGILAHVDAGKTTLSESMLYLSGKIRTLGRVDNKDAYLDTYELEKLRGITIFSKQATFDIANTRITLLDTPGHIDFSAEMERTLQVLDYAILVINGADGIQGHTLTLWHLLKTYKIPVYIFVNKMDQLKADKTKLIKELKYHLSDNIIEFQENKESFYEQVATSSEKMLDTFLKKGQIETIVIQKAIQERKIYPCYFGSALKLQGVEELLQAIGKYSILPKYYKKFAAKVFKIARDSDDNRITYMKVTGGLLKVKDLIVTNQWEEKVNQIRIYSGDKFITKSQVKAGVVCAVTGLSKTKAGDSLGVDKGSYKSILEPLLSYQIILPNNINPRAILPKLRHLEEEEPKLRIVWNETLNEIQVQIMGLVQIEILQTIIKERFNIDVKFGNGQILYKETITNTVEGVGHFEPLGHYAEAHLLLEPRERGKGLKFTSQCKTDILEKNWQRLILSHLKEKSHKGVLIGAAIDDIKVTLVSGKAHNKHTQGGDFRQATYRAVRQGLKEAKSILLEPYYEFNLQIPQNNLGRAMSDIEKMHGTCAIVDSTNDNTILKGTCPLATIRNYQKEVVAYTKGMGRLFYSFKGYGPCHNSEEIIKEHAYNSEKDIDNPTGSIFCKQGVGYSVNWDEVKDYMHLESYLKERNEYDDQAFSSNKLFHKEDWISPDEVDKIFKRTFYANQGKKTNWIKQNTTIETNQETTNNNFVSPDKKEKYLLIDGYNVLYAWSKLKVLAEDELETARLKLLDIISNYQAIKKDKIIVVFDAYRVQGHREESTKYGNIYVVYTKEAQTADQYIERFAYDNKKRYDITVVTSDGLQQIIVRGSNCLLLSAREFKKEVERVAHEIQSQLREKQAQDTTFLEDKLSENKKQEIKDIFGL